MSLENFKNRKIEWDTVNKNFDQSVQIVSGDVNSRTLTIVITDKGEPINLVGYSVKLIYKYVYNDISGFVMLEPTNPEIGEFSLTIPTEMTIPGSIKSNLILLNENLEQVIVSKNLKFISDDSTVTDLAQEVNSKIDDFTKLLLENMPQVMRSELDGLHAQTESNTSNIELKANSSDMTSLQSAMNSLQDKVEAFGITPENLVTIKSLLDAIADSATDSELAELINSVNVLTSNISLMSDGDYSPKANKTDLESLQSAVNNQSAAISTKANKTDLDNLKTTVTSQGVAISTKAEQAEIIQARGGQSSLDSRLDGLDAKDTDLQNQINTNKTSITNTSSRIDNLIANAGNGTVPTELTDIRIGYDGTSYSTAGEAIRKQFELMEKIKVGLVSNKNLFDDTTVTKGYYINYSSGNQTANAEFSASDFIKITGNVQYTLSNQNTNASGGKNLDLAQMAFYDSTKKYISGLPNSGLEATGALTFTAPSNAVYVRFSLYTDLLRYQLEGGSAKTDYVQHKDIVDMQLLPEEVTSAIDYINNQEKNYVIVSKTGGDYNSILRALKNTPPEIEIRIKGGTYNLHDEYIEFYGSDFWVNYTNYANHTDDPFYRGLHLEPGRKLFGDANTVVAFDSGTNQVSADVAPYWSLLAPTWNCEAHNIHFKSPVESTVRYIVHDDFAPIDGFGTTLYQDCTFDGSCYAKAQIGGGLGTDMFYKFDNCRFINNVYIHDISYHSRSSNYDIPPCKVIVSNCFGTQRCAFRWMGKSTNISYCTVNNSKFNTIVCIPYDVNATVKNIELVEFNNTQTGV